MPRRTRPKNVTIVREGARGYTVTLIRRPGRPNLWLRYWDSRRRDGAGDYVWRSLGHSDEERGKAECRELAAVLLVAGLPTDEGEHILTVAEVFAHYAHDRTPHKKPMQQGYDRRRIALWQAFLGATRDVLTIDPDTVERYMHWRRDQGIADTTIGHEVVFFRGVLDWATTRIGTDRKPILLFNPIAKVRRVRSANPRTPVASWGDFLRVYRYADRVDAQRLLRPVLMLAHEHSWRLSAWCQMQASDIDRKPGPYWPHGRIRKRAATDKRGKEQWVPLTPRARRAIDRLIRRSGVIGDAYLFPAPRATGAWRADHALDLLHRAESLAGVELGGFHALRRKWATDRKGQPLVDVANAGDWHPATLFSHYQKADPATTLRVVLGGAKTG